jgi:hypothetical protein
MSVRRATRAGDFDGAAIEDVGVQGHRSYAMTRRDLTGNNGDLRAMCGRLLAAQPRTGLELTLREATVRAAADGLDRLDVYVDGRPVGWHDLPTEGKRTRTVTFERPQGEQLEVLGYAGERLSQRRRLPLEPLTGR